MELNDFFGKEDIKLSKENFEELKQLIEELHFLCISSGTFYLDRIEFALAHYGDENVKELLDREYDDKSIEELDKISLNNPKFWENYKVISAKHYALLGTLTDKMLDIHFENHPDCKIETYETEEEEDQNWYKLSIIEDLQVAIRRLKVYEQEAPDDNYTFYNHHNWVDILLGRKYVDLEFDSKTAKASEILPIFEELLKIVETGQYDKKVLQEFYGSQHYCSLTNFVVN